MNFYCPNSLVGQDHYWAALEEIGKIGATEFWLWPMRTPRSLGAEGGLVNDHFWCSAAGLVLRRSSWSDAITGRIFDHVSSLGCGAVFKTRGIVSLQQFSVICAANSSPVEISSLRLISWFRLIMNACLAGSNVAKQTGTLSTTSDETP